MLPPYYFYWFRIDNKHMTEPWFDQALWTCSCRLSGRFTFIFSFHGEHFLFVYIVKKKLSNFVKKNVDFLNLMKIEFCWRLIFEILTIQNFSLGLCEVWRSFDTTRKTNKQTDKKHTSKVSTSYIDSANKLFWILLLFSWSEQPSRQERVKRLGRMRMRMKIKRWLKRMTRV